MSSDHARSLAYAEQLAATRALLRRPIDIFSQPSGNIASQRNPRQLTNDASAESSKIGHQVRQILDNEQPDDLDSETSTLSPAGGHALRTPRITSFLLIRPEFQKMWSANRYSHIHRIRYEAYSWYVPNCICLFEILAEMEILLASNEQLSIHAPNYFSLPVRVYYAVIFYVHILKSKEKYGDLLGNEGSWLRNFLRQYPLERLPVAGPIVASLANITSCLPDDDQFSYVYPTIPTSGTFSAINSGSDQTFFRTTSVHPTHHLFPSIPLLATALRNFCLSPSITEDMFDTWGQYVPFQLSEGSGTDGFAGIHFAPHANNATNATTAALLSNPALSRPFPETLSQLKEIHSFWRDSTAVGIPPISATDDYNPTTVEDQTLLINDFRWFRSCVNAAEKQARFFTDYVSLSQIPNIGNASCLVESNLNFTKFPTLPTTMNEWYPNLYSDVTARLRSTNPYLSPEMMSGAIFAVSNATLAWRDSEGHPIGSLSSNARGGPYFKNKKYTYRNNEKNPALRNLGNSIWSLFYKPPAVRCTHWL